MAEQQDTVLTSSYGHTIFTEQISMRMIWRPVEKIFCNSRYKEGTKMRQVRGAEMQYLLKTHARGRQTTNGRIITIAEVILYKEQVIWVYMELSPG